MRNIKKKWRNVGFRIGVMLGRKLSVPIEEIVIQHNLVLHFMDDDNTKVHEVKEKFKKQPINKLGG